MRTSICYSVEFIYLFISLIILYFLLFLSDCISLYVNKRLSKLPLSVYLAAWSRCLCQPQGDIAGTSPLGLIRLAQSNNG